MSYDKIYLSPFSTHSPLIIQSLTHQKISAIYSQRTDPSLCKFVLLRNLYYSINQLSMYPTALTESELTPISMEEEPGFFLDSMDMVGHNCMDEEGWFDACLDDLEEDMTDDHVFDSSEYIPYTSPTSPESIPIFSLGLVPGIFADGSYLPEQLPSPHRDLFFPL